MILIEKFNNYINKGSERSIEAKKNIISLFFIKILSIAISLIIVPMTLNYVSVSTYGIWLTLSSIVSWISVMNLGLGNGLRNRFAEAKAQRNDFLAKTYVSTTYAIITIVFTVVWLILMLVSWLVNWNNVLNTNELTNGKLSIIVIIISTYTCFNFIISIINSVLTADQKPGLSSFISLLGQLFSLLAIFLLTKFTQSSLIYLSIALCLSPFLIMIASSLFLYLGKYKKYSPSIEFIDFKYAKELLNVGIKFFVISIAGIIQYQTANVLISHFFGSAEVTSYNIANRYFGVLNMFFSSIIIAPLWSASTEAYTKGEFNWIKIACKKYLKIFLFFIILALLMFFLCDFVYGIWLGKGKVNISNSISLWAMIFYITAMFSGIFISILNGINAIKIQYTLCILSPIVFILTTYICVKYLGLGINAILIGSVLSNFNGFIVAPIQYYKIFYQNKKGKWIQ